MTTAQEWKVKQFGDTLARIPDDIILAMATREFDMLDPMQCVCGWAVRESLARRLSIPDAADTDVIGSDIRNGVHLWCARSFGGTAVEWENLFYGAAHCVFILAIEEAFRQRVADAV